MRNVREKLSGRSWPPDSQAVLDASSIAVLSARLHLDLSPAAPEAKQYEVELVRSHLWVLYSVQYQGVMMTGSSSEPLVAEASAEIMNSTIGDLGRYQSAYMDTWKLLGEFVDLGLAVQGTIGQLIGRALSISAMDRAIDAQPNDCQLQYQTPITVPSYYRAFLTDEAWETLRLSTPSNCAQLNKNSATTTFEDAFADAYFHFSHFAKANDSSPMRDTCSWANWLRGTAILNPFDEQELGDRVAPIYFSSLGTVSPKTMSANLDQDMTRQTAHLLNVGVQSAENLIFSHGNQLPYIAAVHWYAMELNESMTVTTPSTRGLTHSKNNKEAPRYEIDFCGLDAYRITDEVKVVIRRMLGSKNALFNQHCRQYTVPSLRQMLPVLTTDPDATAWFGGIKNEEAPTKSPSKGKGKATVKD